MVKKTGLFVLLILVLTGCGLFSGNEAVSHDVDEADVQTLVAPTIEMAKTEAALPIEEEKVTPQEEKSADIFSLSWEDFSLYSPALTQDAQKYLELAAKDTQYRIRVEISEDYLNLKGHEEIFYTNNEETALPEIYLRIFPNLAGGWVTLSELQVNGIPTSFSWEAASSSAKIELAEALLPGENLLLSMDFSILVPENMGGNYGLFGYFKEVLVLDLFYPMIPAYDENGWYKDAPAPEGDVSYNDASFYLVEVNAPEKLVLVASGVEISRSVEEGIQKVSFVQGPARDFYLAGSEHYVQMSQMLDGGVKVNSYVIDTFSDRQAKALEVASTAIRVFEERIGEYEYTEFDVLSTPMLALGIEYPGIIGISLDAFDPEALISGNISEGYLEFAIAHETAHQWFYNVVGNDQVRHPWLDEAVVQYLTGIYFLDRYGQAAYESYTSSWDKLWMTAAPPAPINLAVGDYEAGQYVAVVYGGGPLFVEALANKMGEDVFFTFLRAYYEENHWGIGTDEEFKTLAEETCQCDLSELFAEWLAP